jgi:hypothetical protein
MKRLEQHIRKNGYDYHQFTRSADKAFYTQRDENGVVGFEVFKVKSHDGYVMQGCLIPPAETFPHDEAFGGTAWTFKDFDKAMTKYLSL